MTHQTFFENGILERDLGNDFLQLAIRIFSFGENFLRVRRRMSRTTASVHCLFYWDMGHTSGSSGPRGVSPSL